METSDASTRLGWLPEALEPVALRLSRVDECAFRIGDVASKWSLNGPLDIEQIRTGDQVQAFLKSIRPVPPETSLLFSEAINHLRACIDNVVWYLVSKDLGRLSEKQASQINMPISETPQAFDNWTKRVEDNKILCLAADTPLGLRIRMLQPFEDTKSSVPSMGANLARLLGMEIESPHPLRLLQLYSNADKHRSIRLTAARTFSSTDLTPLFTQDLRPKELKVGEALSPRSPWGKLSILETNTAAMVQRPAPFTAWVNPVKELTALRGHISHIVLPVLLTGSESSHGLPPVVDLGDNALSHRERLEAGSWDDAHARLKKVVLSRYMEAERQGLQFADVVDAKEKPGS